MTVYGILSDLIGIHVQLQLGYCWTQVNFRLTLFDVRLLLIMLCQHLPMKRMLPNTLRLIVHLCSSSSGVSGPSFLSKAKTRKGINNKVTTNPHRGAQKLQK